MRMMRGQPKPHTLYPSSVALYFACWHPVLPPTTPRPQSELGGPCSGQDDCVNENVRCLNNICQCLTSFFIYQGECGELKTHYASSVVLKYGCNTLADAIIWYLLECRLSPVQISPRAYLYILFKIYPYIYICMYHMLQCIVSSVGEWFLW